VTQMMFPQAHSNLSTSDDATVALQALFVCMRTGGSFALFAQLRRQGLLTSHKIEAHDAGGQHGSNAVGRVRLPASEPLAAENASTPPPLVRRKWNANINNILMRRLCLRPDVQLPAVCFLCSNVNSRQHEARLIHKCWACRRTGGSASFPATRCRTRCDSWLFSGSAWSWVTICALRFNVAVTALLHSSCAAGGSALNVLL